MEEAQVYVKNDTVEVTLHQAPIPTPGPGQILIKVVVTGTNPKDWKFPAWFEKFHGANTGDDIAGYVHAVGEGVNEFRVGDRVASYHDFWSPHGSFAEYAIGQAYATFLIPESVSFEEAATIPLAAMTSALALFSRLNLPEPWVSGRPGHEGPDGGVLIYGAASAIGAFAIKLLQKADIHPIICVAGRGMDFVRGLIDESKGDVVIDYRQGLPAVSANIQKAVPQGKKLLHAFDAVSEQDTFELVCNVLDREAGTVVAVTPTPPGKGPGNVRVDISNVGAAHQDDKDKQFAHVWTRYLALGLSEGWFTPHPHEVIPGGLNGIATALNNLMQGKASAVKYVLRIDETHRS